MGKKPIKTQAKSKVVSARVNEEKAELLNSCAAQRGITVAELISQTIDYIIDPYKELMEDEQDFETAVCQGLSREDRDV